MLEPRVVAAAPATPVWRLDLRYEPEPEPMNFEGMLADRPIADRPIAVRPIADRPIADQNNTPTPSRNGEDRIQSLATEDDSQISFSDEGNGNMDTVEDHQETPIQDEFFALARTLQSLGRDRTQELVHFIQTILVNYELTSTWVDCDALCRNL
jgi:hypothetical protein